LDEVYQKFGEPMKIPNRRCDGGPLGPEVPSYSVFTAIMLVRADQIKDSRILIADFGEAFRTNPPDALHTPVLLLPPEDFFHDKFGPPVDIWTFACTLYEIVGNRTLFECFFGSHEKVVADMISTLGMLPMRWLDQWRKHPYYEINRLEASDTIPLAQRLRNMGRGNTPEQLEQFEFSSEEVESLEKLLKAMLRYESSERITADEVMRSEYMVKWARPAIDSI
jgi:serine/threonine-protein kinase SRPK3